MITPIGARLYRWYQMGIEDIEDLQWLLEFYEHQLWSKSIVGFTLMEARQYFD